MRPCCLLTLLTLGVYLALPAAVRAQEEEPPDKKLKTAEGLVKSGSLAEAEKVLLSIADPPAKALQLLGQVQLRLKKYPEALSTYERYITLETIASKKAAGEALVAELKTLMKTRFKIITTPPGATVYIDSKADGPVGQTPLSHHVTPGKHRLIIELPGYETIKVDVSAVEQQELELPFVLLPQGCELTVTSEPTQAKVFIDGKGAGTTPLGRRLRSGTYRVEAIIKPGEPPVVRQVSCDEKDPKPLQVHLTADVAPAGGTDEPTASQKTPAPAPAPR
ncbi:MAG: PEGA domain-containing protein [Myxococcales bacterium]|nr:PEGA domain-containing protein [Myxococcota bacterium]MDW8284247.1 PEGA domain-containing protein [Myxococcales bacterium]